MYGVDLIIGEETAARLDDPGLIEVDLVAVKGKSNAVRIYTMPPRTMRSQPLGQHKALLAAYRRQEWTTALTALGEAPLAAARYLAPVYALYRRRIAHFQIGRRRPIGTAYTRPKRSKFVVREERLSGNFWDIGSKSAVVGVRGEGRAKACSASAGAD